MQALLAQLKNPAGKSSDRYLLWMVGLLASLGIVAVYSAISFLAETKAGGATGAFLRRHLTYTGFAIAVMLLLSRIDYRKLVKWSMPALLVSIGLLILVQINGVVSGGAARWLRIGPITIQPSEIARVALLLHIGLLLAKKQLYIQDLERGFGPLLFWIMGVTILIGMQDLSTAMLVFFTMLAMSFVARVRILHLTGLGLILVLCATLFLMMSPHRAARVEAWLGVKIFPHTNAEQVFAQQDEGYQAKQAKIAIAMGGITGVGPGKSIQRDFLPAPYNDFIYAIIAEEYGLVGALVLLAVFVFLLFRGFMRVARDAPDPLGLFLATGITAAIALYGFVNAGVACGLLPVTGLPLPFVSYGGTALIANGALMGILLNISRHR